MPYDILAAGSHRPAIQAVLLVALSACGGEGITGGSNDDGSGSDDPTGAAACALADTLLADGGVGRDEIPALTDPTMVSPGDPSLRYLDEGSRVLGVVIDGQPRAYPHNVLWWHEIVNDEVGSFSFAITFCPLTGSGLVFDRSTMGEPDLGVSGLLFANNLIMFDRRSGDLFGPQMSVVGRCGDFRSVEPVLIPVMETSWARWRELHPHTVVVSGETGYQRDYRVYPYGDYDAKENPEIFFPMEIDGSRPPKERVLGVRTGEETGVGYPFDELAALGERGALNDTVEGAPVVVFYEDRGGGTAVAYDPRVAGDVLTFEADTAGFRDLETGTRWDLAGRAVEGPLGGSSLAGIGSAYVSFWFAWRHFQPASRTVLR